ncbi:MAG: hypothetical protein PF637_11550 [Spirochaetes bacterium]|jgi:hypothetical protein|nr:hypothetical protein [Spirochaetota bacterium]
MRSGKKGLTEINITHDLSQKKSIKNNRSESINESFAQPEFSGGFFTDATSNYRSIV